MNSEENIKKWLNEELSPEERTEFEKSDEGQSLLKLNSRLKYFKAPEYDPEIGLEDIMDHISPGNNTKTIKLNQLNFLYKVAAAVTLIVASYFLFIHQPSTRIETFAGEKKEIFLPDSSLVILNANTTLTYVSRKWDKKRTVILEGEAFFKVAKGSTFKVNTKIGTVAVLGTQFNVKDRIDFFEVVCYEGLVSVTVSDNNQKLRQDETLRFVDGQIVTGNKASSDLSPSWINQESSFNSVPFRYVIDELELQYGIKVITNNVDTNKLFTGSFYHEDLDLALQAITKPLNLSYQKTKDGNISLTGERK